MVNFSVYLNRLIFVIPKKMSQSRSAAFPRHKKKESRGTNNHKTTATSETTDVQTKKICPLCYPFSCEYVGAFPKVYRVTPYHRTSLTCMSPSFYFLFVCQKRLADWQTVLTLIRRRRLRRLIRVKTINNSCCHNSGAKMVPVIASNGMWCLPGLICRVILF